MLGEVRKEREAKERNGNLGEGRGQGGSLGLEGVTRRGKEEDKDRRDCRRDHRWGGAESWERCKGRKRHNERERGEEKGQKKRKKIGWECIWREEEGEQMRKVG